MGSIPISTTGSLRVQDVNFGKRLANVPMHTASLWANYVVQNGPATGFGFGGGVRYVRDVYSTNANNLTVPTIVPGVSLPASVVPASTVFDAALSYDFGMRYQAVEGTERGAERQQCVRPYLCLALHGRRLPLGAGTHGAGDADLPVVRG